MREHGREKESDRENGEKKEEEKREKESEREILYRCCITLNLPEYLPSEPYGVYPLTNAHGTQASSLSSLFLARSLLLSSSRLPLVSLVRFLSRFPGISSRLSRSRSLGILPFLFLLRLLSRS